MMSAFVMALLGSGSALAQTAPTYQPQAQAPASVAPGASAPYAQGYAPGQVPGMAPMAPYGYDPMMYGAVPAAPEPMPMDPQAVARSEQQLQGNYAPMERSLGIPLGMTQDAWAKPFKNMSSGQSAPGVVRFQWSQDLVMPVRLRDYMATMIVLPEWEDVVNVYKGESQYLEWTKAKGNVVAVRSLQSGIDTTLTLIGASGNLYTFYLRAESYNTKSITDLMVYVQAAPQNQGVWHRGSSPEVAYSPTDAASFLNRGAAPAAAAGGAPIGSPMPAVAPQADPLPGAMSPPADDAMLVPREKMVFDMSMFEVSPGDREIAPQYVYTDGVWTYMVWPKEKAAAIQMPVVYQVVDGVESRVNTRTAGRFGEVLIAEAVGNFTLRNGAKAVCLKRNAAAQ